MSDSGGNSDMTKDRARPWDAEAMAELLLECGRRALARRSADSWTLKSDGSLITDVDRDIESLLSTTLPAPGEYFIGEETIAQRGADYAREALRGTCWVVDPIDGTSSFAHGFSLWGISIGYMVGGVLRHGAVIMPESGDILVTYGDSVRHYRLAGLSAPLSAATWRELTPVTGEWRAGGVLMLGQRFSKSGLLHLPNPIVATGSAVVALAAVLTGQAQAYVGCMKLWDIAGLLPMMVRLGISGRFADGGEMSCEVTEESFVLDVNSPACWTLRDNCVICVDAWQSLVHAAVTWRGKE
ncbi:MAG: inositol monophosphatase family protein [Lentisphaeria bacterium]